MSPETPSLPIPFAIGETVWWIGSGYQESYVVCPECVGTRALTVILGNGESVGVACATCSPGGFEPPSGRMKVVTRRHAPTSYVCESADVHCGEVTYKMGTGGSGYWPARVGDLFRDRDECAIRCAALNAQHEKDEAESVIRGITRNREKIAWSVHYWRREVADMERKLAAARARLAVCKVPRAEKAVQS